MGGPKNLYISHRRSHKGFLLLHIFTMKFLTSMVREFVLEFQFGVRFFFGNQFNHQTISVVLIDESFHYIPLIWPTI